MRIRERGFKPLILLNPCSPIRVIRVHSTPLGGRLIADDKKVGWKQDKVKVLLPVDLECRFTPAGLKDSSSNKQPSIKRERFVFKNFDF